MEIPEIRRRVRTVLEDARKESVERRQRTDTAAKAYAVLLEQRAVPAFHAFAAALAGEGLRFRVFTPAGSVRLASEASAEDFIELALDSSQDPPRAVGVTSRGRGRRSVSSERPIREGTSLDQLTEEDVLDFLIEEFATLVER